MNIPRAGLIRIYKGSTTAGPHQNSLPAIALNFAYRFETICFEIALFNMPDEDQDGAAKKRAWGEEEELADGGSAGEHSSLPRNVCTRIVH